MSADQMLQNRTEERMKLLPDMEHLPIWCVMGAKSEDQEIRILYRGLTKNEAERVAGSPVYQVQSATVVRDDARHKMFVVEALDYVRRNTRAFLEAQVDWEFLRGIEHLASFTGWDQDKWLRYAAIEVDTLAPWTSEPGPNTDYLWEVYALGQAAVAMQAITILLIAETPESERED